MCFWLSKLSYSPQPHPNVSKRHFKILSFPHFGNEHKRSNFQNLSPGIPETIQPYIETPRPGDAQSHASTPRSLSEERQWALKGYTSWTIETSVSSTSPKQLRPLEANLSVDRGSRWTRRSWRMQRKQTRKKLRKGQNRQNKSFSPRKRGNCEITFLTEVLKIAKLTLRGEFACGNSRLAFFANIIK